ncbi:hypothetical protein M446_5278 [Methylobacterium sp. 4-46]|uniref:hypothetical protein n=1 Tax=unclassified Methylobacterium TaxID=2615210 RepID=UPI000165CB6A|nr:MULTISPECIES: hypothetical protein [Methylobacterium]ACA19602.1 hypothetical protein M446_5278 [Methylobacterium sp. 4-46]WFT78796.1 hypothetical protein QA634_26555 [Methylobacterium nodulans]
MSHSETERAGEGTRALVPVGEPPPRRAVPERPLAPFLVQLLDGTAGLLRPPRQRRSREASARYEAGARAGAK